MGATTIISLLFLHQWLFEEQQAFGIAFSADGKTVLVSNHGDGTISVIDLAEGKVVRTFTAGTGIETLSFY